MNDQNPAPEKLRATNKKIPIHLKDGTVVHLTPSQKAYADAKMALPLGGSLISAAEKAYPNANRDTLRQIVNVNEKNKSLAVYSDKQVEDAKNTVYSLLNSGKDTVRLSAAQDILDRNTGKAIQRTEVSTTQLNIGIDLSSFTSTEEEV